MIKLGKLLKFSVFLYVAFLAFTMVEAKSLKLVSYNIRIKTPEPEPRREWDYRKGEVIDYLSRLDADFIGLQEVDVNSAQYSYIRDELSRLGYGILGCYMRGGKLPQSHTDPGNDDIFQGKSTWGGGGSVPIFCKSSKWEEVDSGYVYIESPRWDNVSGANRSNDYWQYRLLTWGKYKMKSKPEMVHWVMNLHAPNHDNADNLPGYADIVLDEIGKIVKTSNAPIFLLGDFNQRVYTARLFNEQLFLAKLTSDSRIKLKNVFSFSDSDRLPYSSSPWKGLSKLEDFIFYNPDYFEIKSVMVDYSASRSPNFSMFNLPNEHATDGGALSDHFPIVADFGYRDNVVPDDNKAPEIPKTIHKALFIKDGAGTVNLSLVEPDSSIASYRVYNYVKEGLKTLSNDEVFTDNVGFASPPFRYFVTGVGSNGVESGMVEVVVDSSDAISSYVVPTLEKKIYQLDENGRGMVTFSWSHSENVGSYKVYDFRAENDPSPEKLYVKNHVDDVGNAMPPFRYYVSSLDAYGHEVSRDDWLEVVVEMSDFVETRLPEAPKLSSKGYELKNNDCIVVIDLEAPNISGDLSYNVYAFNKRFIRNMTDLTFVHNVRGSRPPLSYYVSTVNERKKETAENDWLFVSVVNEDLIMPIVPPAPSVVRKEYFIDGNEELVVTLSWDEVALGNGKNATYYKIYNYLKERPKVIEGTSYVNNLHGARPPLKFYISSVYRDEAMEETETDKNDWVEVIVNWEDLGN